MRLTQEYSDKTALAYLLYVWLIAYWCRHFWFSLSGYISLSYNNELIHYIILFIAIPVSLYALITGVKNHNTYSYLFLGLFGIAAFILAVTLGLKFGVK